MFNIREIKNFLSKEECLYIIDSINKINTWIKYPNDPFWNERVFDIYSQPQDSKLKNIMSLKLKDVKQIIKKEYNENVYADVFEITRWYPGMSQIPHIDDETNRYPDDNNPFIYRKYGAVIYLNDTYDGGETFYPLQNIKVNPVAGKLIIHPAGGEEHMHGVTEIKNGMRYTISSFWATDKQHSHEY